MKKKLQCSKHLLKYTYLLYIKKKKKKKKKNKK